MKPQFHKAGAIVQPLSKLAIKLNSEHKKWCDANNVCHSLLKDFGHHQDNGRIESSSKLNFD